jgi:hypothetical protein
MDKLSQAIDRVRASRDGHEYHEVWTARKAMQLLLPQSGLVGIAVEGLAPEDQSKASSETAEVADLTLYYGPATTLAVSSAVEILQFKYSISRADKDYRVSDAKKTIGKFAATWREQSKFSDKISFSIITNRPIYGPFEEAIRALADGAPPSGDAAGQAKQFKKACGLDSEALATFARKLSVTGLSGNLDDTKRSVSLALIDWSAASDPIARARLGELTRMVRDKAGHAGTNRNVIRRADVLAALNVADPEDLLPCPASLAAVGKIVEREQLQDAIDLVSRLDRPLLIHAAGGVGKTVFMESLAGSFRDAHEVVFFDCFGGGAYRSPEDLRHLPNRGLVHIVNSLACRGLCDPLLPESDDTGRLLRTFRKRLEQSVATLRRASPAKKILLLLDAIDNAAEHARDRRDVSFPTLLVEAVRYEAVSGVTFILSSRSHRIPLQHGDYESFELLPFTITETEAFLRPRLPDLTDVEIRVGQARSGGNARVLEYLVDSGRGLLDQSEIGNQVELDELIQRRIDDALSVAMRRGYTKASVDAFLAGLAVLPPPVPLEEYAQAHAIELSAVESFAADLWPLLERTKQGLMFRDEPTETLIRDRYAGLEEPLRLVAANLLAKQDVSVYAARALPGLLEKLGDGTGLFDLAFEERFPATITSTVGKRNIRYARLKSAVRYEAAQRNFDRLVHLLLELSTISAVDQRGAEYILGCPDLVIAAKDVDFTRRLFETRGAWQGARHARLAIAYALSGEVDEAYRHAASTQEWVDHFLEQKHEDHIHEPGPEELDISAIPFVLLTQKKSDRALKWMRC